MSRRAVQRTLAALAFAAAAAWFGMGLAGHSQFWPAVLASLALLTTGFYLASAGSGNA